MGKVLVDQVFDRDEQEQLIREQIVDACREMNAKGINQGTSGNISVRFDQGCLITPTSLDYDDMEPDDIVYLLEDGTTDGPRKPSSEWRFHRDILMARPEFNAIVHAHPLKSTALAIMGREIPAVHYMVAVFGGPVVRCAPYATYGTAELSAFAVEAIKDRSA
ncbi:MAG: class II aldolase/adducin family protein, partial [Pseudomonadota bacterium]